MAMVHNIMEDANNLRVYTVAGDTVRDVSRRTVVPERDDSGTKDVITRTNVKHLKAMLSAN